MSENNNISCGNCQDGACVDLACYDTVGGDDTLYEKGWVSDYLERTREDFCTNVNGNVLESSQALSENYCNQDQQTKIFSLIVRGV